MTNNEIIEILENTGKLLEINGLDENRAKSYQGVIFTLERVDNDLAAMSEKDLLKIRGVGKLIASNIEEIKETGTLKEYEDLLAQTPTGVLDMLKIKGLGAKKVRILWKDLGIESIDQLEEAAKNGDLKEVKGFGAKTQENILENIAFLKENESKLRMNEGRIIADFILSEVQKSNPEAEIVGDIARKNEIIRKIQVLYPTNEPFFEIDNDFFKEDLEQSSPFIWRGYFQDFKIPVEIITAPFEEANKERFWHNSGAKHLQYENENGESLYNFSKKNDFKDEKSLYKEFGAPYIVPEMREGLEEFEWAKKHSLEELVKWEDIKGSVHNHSTYSDGKNTLQEMADHAKGMGFEYFGIADHSQSAQYAHGLEPDRIIKQHQEIDLLNKEYAGSFRVLKGIESDILADGSLDYPEEILKSFDYVVASVHSILNMDLAKATQRLIKAIENPYTSFLGHPTGRLLLKRDGYPLDFKKIIDACAANKVIMEINANPMRLDIDWRYIPYCQEKGVLLSINPDAHHVDGFNDMHYGLENARKGGLLAVNTFNTFGLEKALRILKKDW